MNGIGRTLIAIGLVVTAIGLLLTFGPRIPWLGRLPGDFSYEGERVRMYLPLATCVVLSVALSLVLYLFRR